MTTGEWYDTTLAGDGGIKEDRSADHDGGSYMKPEAAVWHWLSKALRMHDDWIISKQEYVRTQRHAATIFL